MGRNKNKTKPKVKKPSALSRWWSGIDEAKRDAFASYFLKIVIVITAVGGAVMGMIFLENHVLTATAAAPGACEPGNYQVQLVDVPSWAPATLVKEIEQSLRDGGMSFNDRNLTGEICDRASRNPWISKVNRVEKHNAADGQYVVTVRAEFRRPVAKVLHSDGMTESYVDTEGVRLPLDNAPQYYVKVTDDGNNVRYIYFADETQAPRNYRLYRQHYITIYGVKAPCPAVGEKWPGEDLADGIRLVELLSTRIYANQFSIVDVRNYYGEGGKYEPRLIVYAQVGDGKTTLVKWGQFPSDDAPPVVSPQRKMANLDEFVQKNNGMIAGTYDWLDLRYEYLIPSRN